ncbi:MAG: hypothetical protein J2P17_06185 [Mycobacterium sp.]|nr:hypothetical protein [Mycobacterium sp.]
MIFISLTRLDGSSIDVNPLSIATMIDYGHSPVAYTKVATCYSSYDVRESPATIRDRIEQAENADGDETLATAVALADFHMFDNLDAEAVAGNPCSEKTTEIVNAFRAVLKAMQ